MKENRDCVSVIVLTYNNLEFLPRCIASIEMQDYPNIEVIVQDDHSDGFNEERILSYFHTKNHNSKKIIINRNRENLGTVKSYNAAIQMANGDIIVPLAGDDQFAGKHVISRIVQTFCKTNCKVCCGIIENEQSHARYPIKKDTLLLQKNNKEILLERLYAANFISGAALFWKRDFLLDIGGFDTSYQLVEDYPMVFYLVNHGIKIECVNSLTTIHGEDGISNRFSTLFGKNKRASLDGKLVKDKEVIPYLKNIKNRRLRRYIEACYYLKYSAGQREFITKFLYYMDVWLEIIFYFIMKQIDSRKYPHIYYYIARRRHGKY